MKTRFESERKQDGAVDLKGRPIKGWYVTVRIYSVDDEPFTQEQAARHQNILHHEWLSRFREIE